MPTLNEVSKLQSWRITGRTWLDRSEGEGQRREVIVATSGGAQDALSLGHAALVSLEPAVPIRVTVDAATVETDPVYIWDPSGGF